MAAQFDAFLVKAAFAPVATAMGFYGDLVVDSVAQTVARRERGGLTDRLARAIEAAGR